MNHFYEEIQGWFNFTKPYREAVMSAPKSGAVFVEIGCWKGRSSAYLGVEIVNSGKDIQLYCVDHWKGSDQVHKDDPELKSVYSIFKANMKKIEGLKMTPIRSDSASAASKFEDESVDFVWVDAGHEYEEVKADIEAWMPKLKRGGVMGGDDYPFDGVSKAVKELLPKHEVGSETGWKWWRVRKV